MRHCLIGVADLIVRSIIHGSFLPQMQIKGKNNRPKVGEQNWKKFNNMCIGDSDTRLVWYSNGEY